MEYLTAEEIVARVKDKIVFLPSQEQMVWNIAGLLNMHMRRIRAIKEGNNPAMIPQVSQLILASTGSGKTFLISHLAEAAGLDFHVIDTSMLTMNGFKGLNLGQALADAQKASSHDFEHAVILFDEFDKCAARKDGYMHEYGNIQPNLLKMLEGTELVDEKVCVDTSEMLFLFCGAFQGLAELVQGRMQKSSPCRKMGFAIDNSAVSRPEKTEQDWLAHATLDDVQRYGFNRELLGRIGSIQYIPPMKEADYRILLQQGKASTLGKYQTLLSVDGVTLEITDQGVHLVSEQAIQRNIGARAANAIISEAMQPTFSEIDKNKKIAKIILDTKGERLVAKYVDGNRIQKKKDVLKIDASKMSLTEYLQDDKGINDICMQMLELSRNQLTFREYLACFSFMQMFLRFLADYCNKEDHIFRSVHTIIDSMKKEKTARDLFEFLDLILNDVLQKDNPVKEDFIILHYYRQFRYMWKENTVFLIAQLVAETDRHWSELEQRCKHSN